MKHHNMAHALLESNLIARPDKIAFHCEDRTVTYAQTASYVRRFATLFKKYGIGPGERIAIVLPDSFSSVFAILGAMYHGAVPIPVSTLLKKTDYEGVLRHGKAAMLISLADRDHECNRVETDFPLHRIFLDDGLLDTLLEGMNETADPFASKEDDPAFILYTSGSTGFPKGVPHGHGELPFLMESFHRDVLPMTEEDTVFSSSKLSFLYGLGCGLLAPMYSGASIVLLPEATTAHRAGQVIGHYRPTLFFGVPTLYNAMLHMIEDASAFSSLRACTTAGEGFPPAVFREWQRKVGIDMYNAYGSTEIYIPIACRLADHPEATGFILRHFEGKLVDDAGVPVPDGEPGVLLVRGKTVISSYWNDPERTRKTILPDGWINTGDVFQRHGEWYTHLGRNDDMLKIGGMWVSPLRVESVLLSHPAVRQCAVVGGISGGFSVLRAHIVVKEDVNSGLELIGDLRRHAQEHLPRFMCPSEFVFCSELPQTATGKIQRFKLRDADRVPENLGA